MSLLFNMLSRFGRVQLEICWLGNVSYFSAKVDTDFPSSGKSHFVVQRRQWQPTPVLLPGKSHGRRRLVRCSPWGCKEWDMTEHLLLGREAITNLASILKSRDFANKDLSSQSYGFSSSHVWMWELDHRESWAPKNWCSWDVMLEKTLESLLDSKEIKPANPKGNQPWIFIGSSNILASWCEQLSHWKIPWF